LNKTTSANDTVEQWTIARFLKLTQTTKENHLMKTLNCFYKII